jgi:predicted metalloprotease with PDZ domain
LRGKPGCHTGAAIAFALALFPCLPPSAHAAATEPAGSRPIEIHLDATQAPRRLLRAHLIIPARPGPLTLFYPKWIHGEHSPAGPIVDMAGLTLRAAGTSVPWQRDEVDLYAFHCTVPEGADAVEATLEYLAPSSKDTFTPCAMTARLAMLHWHVVLLYPRGRPVGELRARASLTLPTGWKAGTALPVVGIRGTLTEFDTVSLETLVDSPVLCGAHFREIRLGTSGGPPHFLVAACDSAAGLEVGPELRTKYERLVAEAGALFGGHHYRSYRFLLALSDQICSDGIEHHECSDNRAPEHFLVDDIYRPYRAAWLLPHEYVHSWNGKYRRPQGLATADFQQPMRTRLLWVYEGLTQYLGYVLTARSGLYTPEASRANLALIGDWAANQAGRSWRPLEDTAVAAPHLYGARDDWAARRRGVDFYDEGALLWLDVDTLLRSKSGGRKSVDDFCREFFGGDGPPEVKTYTLEDIVQALDRVVAHSWKAHLQRRLRAMGADPPLDGLARSGWRLRYRSEPGEMFQARQDEDDSVDLSSSIGLLLQDDGTVADVVPNKAADRARIGPGMKLLAVNGRRWTAERLREAIAATRRGGKLELLLENGDFFETHAMEYTAGARFPELTRDHARPDLLSDIFRPRCGKE